MIMLLHISDLHIGEKPQWVGSFNPRSLYRQPTRVPSSRGHDERVAQDFALWWERLHLSYPSARIVATGDLTRQGDSLDFGCAHRFLHAFWPMNFPNPLTIGLEAGGYEVLTVPGNHDFWNGWKFPVNAHIGDPVAYGQKPALRSLTVSRQQGLRS